MPDVLSRSGRSSRSGDGHARGGDQVGHGWRHLVVVAGLGLGASASSKSPEQAARALGLAGLVTNSIATAAQGSGRWYALLIGIPVLLYVTRSLLRTLIISHRLVWIDMRIASAVLNATLWERRHQEEQPV